VQANLQQMFVAGPPDNAFIEGACKHAGEQG